MRAAIYSRFSSDRQRDRSIEDQISLCRSIAEREGLTVIELFEDRAISGTKGDRPGFVKLMNAAKARRFDVLICEDTDRLTRSQADFHATRETLGYCGIRLLTGTGYVDRIGGSVRALLNEMYVSTLAGHTHRGMVGVLADGRSPGGQHPYGYAGVPGEPGVLRIDEDKAVVVREIYAQFAAGKSAFEIARDLNNRGVPAPRGKLWSASELLGRKSRENGVLGNSIYRGLMTWNRTTKTTDRNPETGRRGTIVNPRSEWKTVSVPHLRIVSDELHERVQSIRVRRSCDGPRSGSGALAGARAARMPRHVLSGLIKCACCGAGLQSIGKHGGRTRLMCSSHRENGSCQNAKAVYLDDILGRVSSGLREHLANPILIEAFVTEYNAERRKLTAAATSARPALERRLADIERQITNMVEVVAGGGGAVSALVAKLTALEVEQKQVAAKLASIPTNNVIALHPRAIDRYHGVLDKLGVELAKASPEEITILRSLISSVTVHTETDGSVNLDVKGRIAHLCSVGSIAHGCRSHPWTPCVR
ncbi:site-specific DNA recombinase [Bradyrhizobium sp. USDA 4011]